jgi:glycosyltransferase involved in cell wall biosynthesis
MRILYISQYFPPEMGAPAARVHELSRAWVDAGHSVTVLTAFPHHPTGVIPPAYRKYVTLREKVDGIDVLRTWVYATPNKGVLKRSFSYVSFMVSSVILGFPKLVGHYDAVIATSPQFLVAVAGWIIARLLGRPFVFEVRDLWPESIVAVGAIRSRAIIAALETVEMFLYRRARLIVAVAESTVGILSRRGIPASKVAVVTNGVDLEKFRPSPRDESLLAKYGLKGKFVTSYIGTIGLAHGLEIVLDAAEKTRGDEGLAYLVVGEGARRKELEAEADRRGLSNIVFTGEVPRDEVPKFLAASDAVLVHLRKTELFENVIPSKVFEIMGAGRPIIMGVRGEAGKIVSDAGAGVAIEPENADELVAAVTRLRDNPGERAAMGRAGRTFVEEHYDRKALARRYIIQLHESIALNQALEKREPNNRIGV